MTKVITYGTFDLLHHGHVRLLKRAKALGDYLIVGVTSDDFDKARGKINVQQSVLERIAAIKASGLADEIIVEEYEGQKIDDIRRFGVDIFAIGSDWEGKFEYLKEYCAVVYLPRTKGVSSSSLRTEQRSIRLGLVGEGNVLTKYKAECSFVNGITIAGICTQNEVLKSQAVHQGLFATSCYTELLERSDAVYLVSHPSLHYKQTEIALYNGKHVLCEAPIVEKTSDLDKLYQLADTQKVILMDAIKTAYSTAYYRLLLLLKSGCIGTIVSVDATCTSLMTSDLKKNSLAKTWNSICAWGPVAMLPIFQLLGTNYSERHITTCLFDQAAHFDIFTKIDFLYPNAVGSVKVGKGVKSEGELIISGTKGYIYVPAPWWKTDYFEIRYENPSENRRCFYQLEGEGIRYELVNFVRSIETGRPNTYITRCVSRKITEVIEAFYNDKGLKQITVKP